MFTLDETIAKLLLRAYVQECEFGIPLPPDFDQMELEKSLDELTLDYFSEDHAQSVDEILYLILEGQGLPENGALAGGEGYRITAYPMGFSDSCDVLITLRYRDPYVNRPWVQVADSSCDEVRHLYSTDHGIDMVLEICRSAIETANRLQPSLQALDVWHQQQLNATAEGR